MRVVFTLLLLIAATPALAQWVKVDEKDNAIHDTLTALLSLRVARCAGSG